MNLGRARELMAFFGALLSGSDVVALGVPSTSREGLDRRAVLATATGLLTSTVIAPTFARADETVAQESETLKAYRVIPDPSASLNPELAPVEKSALLQKASLLDSQNGGALWLGEHHNSIKDHTLQKDIIESVYRQRKGLPMAIGLEQVQIQFQPALDDYISGKISLEDMKSKVEWEKRWFWSFDGYAPIFETAKKNKIPLIALNVNSEDLAEVEQAGLAGLPKSTMGKYIKDPQGFATFAQQGGFKEYVNYVISPSYDLHERMGLLKTTISGLTLEEPMTFRNFFSGRILWDESMASGAYSWVQANPGGLLVGLVGADHVKFRDGVPGRFARMGGNDLACISVMLNPTLIDTRPSGSVAGVENAASSQYPDQITLQLRFLKDGVNSQDSEIRRLPESTGGVLPLADYIVVG